MNFWDETYISGAFKTRWEYSYPSQELVAISSSQLISAGDEVVDLGCGAGNEAIYLAECGYRVIGIDDSHEALEIAKKRSLERGVSVAWRQGSVLDLPIENGSITFANDRGCFHHIKKEDRFQYAKEIYRILKSEAFLLLRGCREENSEPFIAVTQEDINLYFPKEKFTHDPVRPITLISDDNTLLSNLVVIKRK